MCFAFNKEKENDMEIADAITEVQVEEFLSDPISAIIDVEIKEINITEIGNDMSNDQKEKAQEVVVPVILTRIISLTSMGLMRRFDV